MRGWWDGWKPGDSDQDWYDTPVVRDDPAMRDTPNWAEFERFLSGSGFGGNDIRSQWARGQFNRADAGYRAEFQSNPGLTYRQYLDSLGPGFLDAMFASLTPSQRGANAPAQTRIIRR